MLKDDENINDIKYVSFINEINESDYGPQNISNFNLNSVEVACKMEKNKSIEGVGKLLK